jgi:hypothetical protein
MERRQLLSPVSGVLLLRDSTAADVQRFPDVQWGHRMAQDGPAGTHRPYRSDTAAADEDDLNDRQNADQHNLTD